MIVRAAFPSLITLFVALASLAAGEKHQQGQASEGNAGLERFKLLAGDWVGKAQGPEGREIHVNYKVISSGTGVVETLFPGTEHEMITVIYADGPDLLLTHYCGLGNHPNMKAGGNGDGSKIEFKFVRATNLKSPTDMHMHDVTYTFVDKDTLKAQWTHYKDGKASGQVDFEIKRKK
jgi:hypothetical protein